MNSSPVILSHRHVRAGNLAFKASLAIAVGVLILIALRLFTLSAKIARDSVQIKSIGNSVLALKGKTASQPPAVTVPSVAPGEAVATIQTDLERAARKAGCSIDEFQASPDRAPYLCAFTADTNEPEWEQIPIKLTLRGTLAATLGTVDSLRNASSPVEPDSLEISRQSVSERGVAEVSVRLGFRVLVRVGVHA